MANKDMDGVVNNRCSNEGIEFILSIKCTTPSLEILGLARKYFDFGFHNMLSELLTDLRSSFLFNDSSLLLLF